MGSRMKRIVAAVTGVAALAAVVTVPSVLHGGGPTAGSSSAGAGMAQSGESTTTGPSGGLGGQQSAVGAAAAPVHAASSNAGQLTDVPVVQPRVIRTGTLDLRVSGKQLTNVFDTAGNDAASAGGYVQSSSTSGSSGDNPSANLVLRVPSTEFEKLVGEIAGLGKVLSESTQGQDVTGAIININARIANLTAEETSLRQLITQAGSIPQILNVEDQLFGVEQQIEELSGQQTSLANQVAYGTLTVQLSATAVAKAPAKGKAAVNAFTQGAKLAVHNTAASLHGIAIAIGAAFPALLLLAIAGAVVAVTRRRKRPEVRPAE